MIATKSISMAVFALAATGIFAQTDQQPIRVVVDNNPVQFANQQPAMSNGRVLVPLRGVFETLGASVDWNPANQTISARKGESRVRLAIGQLDASVDGKPVHMDVPATLVGGTTMVPLRFVSEALGAYVTWNAANHEVDITSSTKYNLPHGDHDRDRDRRQPPPPPPVIKNPPHRNPPHARFDVLPVDTVIPFVLNTRLSSSNAQRGDQFTANLIAGPGHQYMFLREGTVAYGSVSYVRRQHGADPGVIELSFDHLVLPDGRNIPIVGKLIGLDGGSVVHMAGGALVARDRVRNDHVMFTGYTSGAGTIVGIKTNNALEDRLLSGLLNAKVDRRKRDRVAHDVELRPGTQLGVRLYAPLSIEHR